MTSDQTSCGYYNFDWIGVGNSGSTSGAEENGGVFNAGTYDFTIFDTAGDSLDGGAGIYFETRAAGSSGAWNTVQSETGFIGSSRRAGSITVPTGDEMRLHITVQHRAVEPVAMLGKTTSQSHQQ